MVKMKLVNITFSAIPKLPGIRPTDLGTIDCDKPSESLRGWKLVLRGQQAFFVSPPGWVRDQSEKRRNPKGPVTVFEIDRSEITLHWCGVDEGADGVEALIKRAGKWESQPFGWQPATIITDKQILEQIPASQLGD